MLNSFTNRAIAVLKLAEQDARQRNHEYIGTEHLLMGLLEEASILVHKSFRADNVRRDLEGIIKNGPPLGPSAISELPLPFTPRSKMAIGFAEQEAKRAHRLIGPRELLIGLLSDNNNVAAQVLMNQGLTLASLKTLPYSQD
jgi:ATP-dependent Clp protease ATP-binding subunit ClpC